MAKEEPAHNQSAIAVGEPAESGERSGDYKVRLEVFEGPLDLLLYLIRKDEIDVYDIPIARITEQYLEHLRLMKELDIAVAGDFLVMAATLIYIKSKMLLPPEPSAEADPDLNEDPRAELVAQLLEYRKFKSAANMLYARGEIEAACYGRGSIDTDANNPEVTATVFDLLRVFREILDRQKSVAEMEIHRDETTMSEKLEQIRRLVGERGEINVREVFALARSRRELILTFLAFLELVKETEISLIQERLFGEILARPREPIANQ